MSPRNSVLKSQTIFEFYALCASFESYHVRYDNTLQSVCRPTELERVSFFPYYFGVFPPYFFPLIYKDILMKKIVPTG
jgi:hypothetical protein